MAASLGKMPTTFVRLLASLMPLTYPLDAINAVVFLLCFDPYVDGEVRHKRGFLLKLNDKYSQYFINFSTCVIPKIVISAGISAINR